MPRIEFEADTEEQLLALAWRWVMGPQRQSGGSGHRRQIRPTSASPAGRGPQRHPWGGQPPAAARGGGASTRDEALVLDAGAGGAVRKAHGHRIRRNRGRSKQGDATGRRRDLVTWDADVRGYRMDPADAEIVLQRWPAPRRSFPLFGQTKSRDGDFGSKGPSLRVSYAVCRSTNRAGSSSVGRAAAFQVGSACAVLSRRCHRAQRAKLCAVAVAS